MPSRTILVSSPAIKKKQISSILRATFIIPLERVRRWYFNVNLNINIHRMFEHLWDRCNVLILPTSHTVHLLDIFYFLINTDMERSTRGLGENLISKVTNIVPPFFLLLKANVYVARNLVSREPSSFKLQCSCLMKVRAEGAELGRRHRSRRDRARHACSNLAARYDYLESFQNYRCLDLTPGNSNGHSSRTPGIMIMGLSWVLAGGCWASHVDSGSIILPVYEN